MTTLLITVTTHLSTYQLELDTDIDIELPYHEFIEKLAIHSLLDKEYSGWTKFEIDLTEIPKRDWELKLEETQNAANIIAEFDNA